MRQDKSLFFYGRPYHRFIDILTQVHRAKIISLIPEGAVVLDVGCGTGELALALRKTKGCQVVGVDLSLQMINYAQSRNPYDDVVFLHRDAADIGDYKDGHFEYAVLCQVIHELPREAQVGVLGELVRLGQKAIVVDYNIPLPKNVPGIVSRLIEVTIGRDHLGNFKAYLAAGGIPGILKEAGLSQQMKKRLEFNNKCHQIVVLG